MAGAGDQAIRLADGLALVIGVDTGSDQEDTAITITELVLPRLHHS